MLAHLVQVASMVFAEEDLYNLSGGRQLNLVSESVVLTSLNVLHLKIHKC